MKKIINISFLIFSIMILPALLISCKGVDKAKRSLVTITIGSDKTVSIKSSESRLLATLRKALAGLFSPATANAQIPSVVSDVRVTVSAPDMESITKTVSVSGLDSVSIMIEVPNGSGRTFLAEGLNTAGVTVYQGQTVADLTGMPLSLTITLTAVSLPDTSAPVFSGLELVTNESITSMQLSWSAANDDVTSSSNIIYLIYQAETSGGEVYSSETYSTSPGATSYTATGLTPGTTYYFVVRAKDEAGNVDTNTVEKSSVYPGFYVDINSGNDTNSGSLASPFATITRGLSSAATTTTADAVFVAAGTYSEIDEIFPLQLYTDTALVCLGANFSTVIDDSAGLGLNSVIVNDATGLGGTLIEGCKIITAAGAFNPAIDDLSLPMSVNRSLIQGGTSAQTGVAFTANSTLSNSKIIGFIGVEGGWGITITGANAVISQNTITANDVGIKIEGGSPSLETNTITNNNIGIYIFNASPLIVGSIIKSNNTGMDIYIDTAENPVINTSEIYCNVTYDVYVNSTSGVSYDLRNNAWDHAPPNVYSGALSECMGIGDDICWWGAVPLFDGYGSAVVGGCP